MISNENLLISGKLLLYGNTREPPAKISSVDILSPIFNKIGRRKSFGSASISGIEATFGPLLNFTCFASSYGRGASNKFTSFALCFGIFVLDRKSTRLNSSHVAISYAVFCLKKKTY